MGFCSTFVSLLLPRLGCREVDDDEDEDEELDPVDEELDPEDEDELDEELDELDERLFLSSPPLLGFALIKK